MILIFQILFSVTSSSYPADLDEIYTKIKNISWPPDYDLNPHSSDIYTDFYFETKYQIINNGSRIHAYINKAPYFIPRMNTSLVNSSLNPGISYVFLTVSGDIFIEEGISNRTGGIGFCIPEYRNETLPLGNYTFWYDVIDILKYTIQLIPFYTTINVTENQIKITHQGFDTTITYPEQLNETSISQISGITIIILFLVIKKRKKVSILECQF